MKRLLSFFVFILVSYNSVAAPSDNYDLNAISVILTLDGKISVKNTSSDWYWWSIEYGPEGFTPGTGTLVENMLQHTIILNVNQFQNYHIRIRNKLVGGYLHDWSQMFLLDNCATSASQPVGHYNNFNSFPGADCWRGYNSPLSSSSDVVFYDTTIRNGATGSSVRMRSQSTTSATYLVAPRMGNMNTTKKISFYIRGYIAPGLSVGTLTSPSDPSTFHLLENITPVSTATQWYNWVMVTVNFDNYNGTDQYLVLKLQKPDINAADITVHIDDFRYQERCYDVTNLTVTNEQEHSAQLNFTAPSGQQQWEITYRNLENTWSETTMANTNPFTLQGLSSNATYEVKIRAKCEDNNYSPWSALVQFNTPCVPMTTGFSYSFDESALDRCWYKKTVSAASVYPRTATSNVTPRSGTHMLYMDNWQASNDAYLISRYTTDLSNTKRIKFFMIAYGQSSNYYLKSPLIIGTMSDPADVSTFIPLKTISPTEMSEGYSGSSNSYWKMHTVNLDNYNAANNHHYIAIKHGRLDVAQFYIDDFSYGNIPACEEPLSLKATPKYGFVKLSWTGAAPSYQIEYGPTGFVPGTGTMANSSANSLDLPLPNDSATYDFYVRAVCGSEYSEWSEKRSFRTKCEGVSAGYTHGFEGDALNRLNPCWTAITASNTNNGTNTNNLQPSNFIKTIAGTAQRPAHIGTNMIQHQTLNTPAEKNILVMPRLNDFNNLKILKFWMYVYNISSGQSRQIIVGTLSDPDDHTTFTPVKTITVTSANYDQWKEYVVDFSLITGTDKYVGIRQAASNGNQVLYFDDFSYETITCATPTNLSSAQTSASSATLSWTSNSADTQQTYELLIDGQSVITTQNPYTVNNLAQGGYGFKVRNLCINGLVGDWSTAYIFKISCVKSAPFTENFDSYATGDFFEDENWCWTTYNNEPMFDHQTSIVSSCIDQLNSCPNMLELNSSTNLSNVVDAVGMITSPYFSDFGNTKKIRFFAKHQWEETYVEDGGFIVGTMTNPYDNSTFVPYQTISLNPEDLYGREYEVDFSGYTGTAKHIAIKNSGAGHNYLHIDDFKYSTINVSCPEPLNVRMIAATSNTATAGWIETGSGQNFAVEYGPQGFTPGAGTTVSGTGNQLLMPNLAPSTQYEFYIKAICGSTQSTVQGPFKFFTTCVEPALPYFENFAGMTQYGDNILPNCFRMKTGGLKSSNVGIHNGSNNFYPSYLMQGNNDSNFIYANDDPEFITPVFNMTAGTSYTFTMMGRKVYQWNGYGLFVRTGRSNSVYNIVTGLTNTSPEFDGHQYKPATFIFTPIVSGNYSYHVKVSGNPALLLDDFKVTEGYTATVSGESANFDFTTQNSALLLEATDNTAVALNGGNVMMTGGNDSTLWLSGGNAGSLISTDAQPQNSFNVWEANENFITKINMKVNATSLSALYMNFDLRQMFKNSAAESMFRVVVNGTVVGTVIMPTTASGDAFTTHYVNLSQFAGADVKISLQHIGRSAIADENAEEPSADNAYVDNIIFSQFPLSVDAPQFNGFKLYPNPAKNSLSLENSYEISDIEIYSVNGQQLYKENPASRDVKIDVSGFSEGLYLIKIISEGRAKTFKFVKN